MEETNNSRRADNRRSPHKPADLKQSPRARGERGEPAPESYPPSDHTCVYTARPVMLALGRWRQQDVCPETAWAVVRPCLRKKQNKQKPKTVDLFNSPKGLENEDKWYGGTRL